MNPAEELRQRIERAAVANIQHQAGMTGSAFKQNEPNEILKPEKRFRKVFAMDIETYPDPSLKKEFIDSYLNDAMDKRLKDPDKVAQNRKDCLDKFALDPMTGMITMIGTLTDPKEASVYYGIWNYTSEKDMLSDFWYHFNDLIGDGHQLITKGGKRFDLPYIFFRSIKLEVEIPDLFTPYSRLINKYNEEHHLDLENYLVHGIYKNAFAMGLTDTWENNGKECIGMFENKEYAKLVEKNATDLKLTLLIHDRMRAYL